MHHHKILTKWVVITGAPASGKSSVLDYLSSLGYKCFKEVAREYVQNHPENVEKLRSDEAKFQRIITSQKELLERSIENTELVFLDRGLPDSITYYRVADIDPEEARKRCFNYIYKTVFMFERLSLVKDGVRTECEDTAAYIDEWLPKDYSSVGYTVVNVPIMSIKQRAEYILKRIV